MLFDGAQGNDKQFVVNYMFLFLVLRLPLGKINVQLYRHRRHELLNFANIHMPTTSVNAQYGNFHFLDFAISNSASNTSQPI